MTLPDRATFEGEFGSRTALYLAGARQADRPVVLLVGDDARTTPAGQAFLLALCNMLARAHQTIVLVGNLDEPLHCPSPFGTRTLREATAGLITAIHPWRDVRILSAGTVVSTDTTLTIACGTAPGNAHLRVGADGWVARFGEHARFAGSTVWGAGLAACVVANAAFQASLGRCAALEGDVSLWLRGARGDAQGPDLRDVDAGALLQVGAGGVGSALDFWAILASIEARWTIVDHDIVGTSNLNRQLAFTAGDLGELKATVCAQRLGAAARRVTTPYGTDSAIVEAQYDLVLPLANEHGARPFLHLRGEPLLLHATTSRAWQAQLHRHQASQDDCLTCRIPEELATTGCSTAPVAPRQPDAALPFLSAAAGLLLCAEVARHAVGLDEPDAARNYYALDFTRTAPATQALAHSCQHSRVA